MRFIFHLRECFSGVKRFVEIKAEDKSSAFARLDECIHDDEFILSYFQL